jgi:hypothetical protein
MKKQTLIEKISWYKLLFTVLVTMTAAGVGWFVNNYKNADLVYLNADFVLTFFFVFGIIFSTFKINIYIRKLEERKK